MSYDCALLCALACDAYPPPAVCDTQVIEREDASFSLGVSMKVNRFRIKMRNAIKSRKRLIRQVGGHQTEQPAEQN